MSSLGGRYADGMAQFTAIPAPVPGYPAVTIVAAAQISVPTDEYDFGEVAVGSAGEA